jgi:RNA polymerase sigma-70 factor, ECF subfamily
MDAGLAAKTEAEHLRDGRALPDETELRFEEAYLRFRDPVFRYVRSFAGTDDEAAELTAKTFERALTKLPSYRGGSRQFAAWLFRIARSQAVDATRRRRPLQPLELVRPERHPISEEGRPEPDTIQRETSQELAAHLQRLPRLQQECLALRYAAGLTAREVGDVIGKSEAATQKLMSRALARLRESYT